MICVELSFTDAPARLAARPAHRERLGELYGRGDLLMAGPWKDDSGAMLIFTVDRTRLDRIMAEDPYFSTEGVRVVSLRDWRPVVASTPPDGS
jgi:uncharacterized protein YciI